MTADSTFILRLHPSIRAPVRPWSLPGCPSPSRSAIRRHYFPAKPAADDNSGGMLAFGLRACGQIGDPLRVLPVRDVDTNGSLIGPMFARIGRVGRRLFVRPKGHAGRSCHSLIQRRSSAVTRERCSR